MQLREMKTKLKDRKNKKCDCVKLRPTKLKKLV